MAGLNKIQLIGNIGKDLDNKMTPSGVQVVKFSLGVTEKVKGEDSTEWFNIVLFNK